MKHLLLPLLLSTAAFAESEWTANLAYGCWAGKHQAANLALLHVQGTQRLLPDPGTWLRVELSGSWRLHRKDLPATFAHADYFGPHTLYLPELALMQHFADGRVSLVAGMVNLANDVDAVGIANDSFYTFAHSAFTNSSVLPLPDANVGGVLHVDFSDSDHAALAVSRTGSGPGGNPFRSGPPGVCVVGEYSHAFQAADVTLRLNPFYHQHRFGLAGSVEYDANDRATFFVRSGIASTPDFSCGALFKPIPSRPDDFLGIAYASTKGETRENTVELMYNLPITDYLKLMPHVQYTSTGSDHFLFGIQAVISF